MKLLAYHVTVWVTTDGTPRFREKESYSTSQGVNVKYCTYIEKL